MFWSCWRSGWSRGSPIVRFTCWAPWRSVSTFNGFKPSSACQRIFLTRSLAKNGTKALRYKHKLYIRAGQNCLHYRLRWWRTLPYVPFLQTLCKDASVEEVLRRHFNTSKDFRSMHALLVRTKKIVKRFWEDVPDQMEVYKIHPRWCTCFLQMLCLSRVSVSKPVLKPADVLEASKLRFADAKGNMLHGKRLETKI